MKNAEGRAAQAEILPPEAVEDAPPVREAGGVVLPVVGMILALVAAWLVLTLLGVIGDRAPSQEQAAAAVTRTSSCC